jgi:hypothetical protein
MILDGQTGRQIPTSVLAVAADDLLGLGRGWSFDWRAEVEGAEVYKLVAKDDPPTILGLISMIRRSEERYIEVPLRESSPENVGRRKRLVGIAGNLLAYAATLSLKLQFEGFLFLEAKTVLIDHYCKAYGFQRVGRTARLVLAREPAARLIERYPMEPD